jgi:hypothetical protein
VNPADLDAIAARVVDAAARGDDLSPDAALFLVRCYLAAARDDVGGALGTALARALEAALTCGDAVSCAAWLTLFCEAAPIADDERIAEVAGALVDRIRATWPGDAGSPDGLAASAASVDACLRAARLVDPASIVQPAIDELERFAAAAYRPGEGLRFARSTSDAASDPAAHADAHVACASALLTAFEVTGRLPYSMLAEELMQHRRRVSETTNLPLGCAAARVFCRLAALHADGDYLAAAVVAPGADYREFAARILRSCAAQARAVRLTDAARYGIALGEFMALR